MICHRLDHFVKLDTGSNPVQRCCHMVNRPSFSSLSDLESSQWLIDKKAEFAADQWPAECIRCKISEGSGRHSVRISSNACHDQYSSTNQNYLVIDIVFDTECNAACPICSKKLSSLIAKLEGSPKTEVFGYEVLKSIDPKRITQLDILGGEPAVSKMTKEFLSSLPGDFTSLQKIRVNTNGSKKFVELEHLLKLGLKIDVTLSMDGTGQIFEYARYPIKWEKFKSTVEYYRSLRKVYPNLVLSIWGVHSALSIIDMDSVMDFGKHTNIQVGGSVIDYPNILRISNRNFLTIRAKEILSKSNDPFIQSLVKTIATELNDSTKELNEFIDRSDAVRGIKFDDYYASLGINRK